jgi:hypothetical protein
MSVFSNVADLDSNVDTNKNVDEIFQGGLYTIYKNTIDKSVYACINIGSEKLTYRGRVEQNDLSLVHDMEQQDIPRFDFLRLGFSTDKPRFLSISKHDLSDYRIEKYSFPPAFWGGKKSRSKGSRKSRSKGSRKSRRSK